MKKAIVVGIIVIAIIVGVVSALSTNIISLNEGSKGESGTSSENPEDEIGPESKPSGRNLSIEFDEKLGLSAP